MRRNEQLSGTEITVQKASGLEAAMTGLFAPDGAIRETAVAQMAAQGREAIPALAQMAFRPLAHVQKCWPEWQRMLPTQAIMARSRAIRGAAIEALTAIGSPSVRVLTRMLQSRDVELRQAAAEALAQMDAREATLALRHLLYQERAQNRLCRGLYYTRRIVGGGLIAASLLLMSPALPREREQTFYLPLLIGFGVWCALALADDRSVELRRVAVEALSRAHSKRHVGALALCLSDADETVRKSAAQGLLQTLPLLRAEDREYLAPNEINALLAALDAGDDALAVAVLSAMQQIGDTRVLHRVAFLIDSPVHNAPVRAAAFQCLPHVKQRLKAEEQAQALLRPAHCGEAIAANVLLRPVSEEADATTSPQLLRPR